MKTQPTTQHTPIYTAEKRGDGWSLCSRGNPIYFNRSKEEAERAAEEANARRAKRISYEQIRKAAPELLAALGAALQVLELTAKVHGYDTSIGVVPRARAAIAKAKGVQS